MIPKEIDRVHTRQALQVTTALEPSFNQEACLHPIPSASDPLDFTYDILTHNPHLAVSPQCCWSSLAPFARECTDIPDPGARNNKRHVVTEGTPCSGPAAAYSTQSLTARARDYPHRLTNQHSHQNLAQPTMPPLMLEPRGGLPLRTSADHIKPKASVDQEMDALPPTTPKLRPEASRANTEPSPAVLLQSYFSNNPPTQHQPSTHRNRSPYARPHLRSKSSGSALAAPAMTRAHSLPAVHTVSCSLESAPSSGSLSPLPSASRSPARVRSPFRPQEDGYNPPPRSPSWYEGSATTGGAIESIQEDSELDITPRQQPMQSALAGASFSRSSGSLRRRPASPLHSVSNAPQAPTSFPASVIDANANISMTPTSTSSSPSLGPTKYNEGFPSSLSLHHYASTSSFSSISSTPSSMRSRSPSISSLETIEDAPDLESQAIEAERIRKLRLAADGAESEEDDDGTRRKSLDVPRGFGFGRNGGSGRERKRWSICGGERRGDLDLETIWED